MVTIGSAATGFRRHDGQQLALSRLDHRLRGSARPSLPPTQAHPLTGQSRPRKRGRPQTDRWCVWKGGGPRDQRRRYGRWPPHLVGATSGFELHNPAQGGSMSSSVPKSSKTVLESPPLPVEVFNGRTHRSAEVQHATTFQALRHG
jgi:hypothetical protein